jgi:dCMP deaminase
MSNKRKNLKDSTYIQIAEAIATESKATRLQVGAVIVKDGHVLGTGYNGMPSGMPNKCEDENNVTKPEVIHAEVNAIASAHGNGLSTVGSELYVTYSCCNSCSAAVLAAGISRVVYSRLYRDESPLKFLRDHGVETVLLEK